MYLLEQCRDPHSVKWMEEFLETPRQLEYHGTGAAYLERFGNTWDGPLVAMMQAPKDVVVVSAKRRGRGHGGWSKDNPFLEERFVEFHIDIDPVSLVGRILSVREQLAKEWAQDLDVLQEANAEILDSYFCRAKREREQDVRVPTTKAFEPVAVHILSNRTEFTATSASSSPLRKGNFDLLYNLCTQASIHRLLWRLADQGEAKEVSFEWFKRYYQQRAADFFDGDQRYGRADEFLGELLLTPPSVIYSNDGETGGLADPMGIAESIIEIRKEIVQEWKTDMFAIPESHMSIRRDLLTKQMEAWGSSNAKSSGFD